MRFLLGVLMLMISGSALATIDVLQFKDEAQEQQFRQLTEELRCPKCQNNSIADSNSMIATDLRQKVYELMQEGKSKKEIVDYMVARYGNFVTYDSAVNAADRAAVGAASSGYWHWRLGHIRPFAASGTRGAGSVSRTKRAGR